MHRCIFTLFLTSLSLLAVRSTATSAIELDPAAAAPTRLVLDGKAIPSSTSEGGFSVHDFQAKRDLPLRNGQVSMQDGSVSFTAEGADIMLSATFTPMADGTIEVAGEVATRRPVDRALIVRYTLPVPAEGADFQNGLSHSVTMGPDSHALGTAFPIASLTGRDWGVSLAIPPTFPCCFGLTGTSKGLGIEFYLGLSPLVEGFPNRARFAFTIDAAMPGWGFRSALASYYQRHSEYYEPRHERAGLWNWNDRAGIDQPEPPAIVEEALPFFLAHGLTHADPYAAQIARNRRHGVLSFAYIIAGQREITDLPKLPEDEDGAAREFAEFKKKWEADGEDGPLHQHFGAINGRNRDLVSQIETSTVFNADGNRRIRIRDTAWGGNSITFVQNPNPDLFRDRGVSTVGSVALDLVSDWCANDPADGIHIDSIGSQWPSCLNYRREHFRYARYPLTFDKDGIVALHNRISHYEFVASVREIARRHDKLLFANGMDIYSRRGMPEHYNSIDNSRFFMSALVDIGGREITHDLLSRERLEAYRLCLGPKVMTAILYIWTEPELVRAQMNRSLPFAVFSAPNRFFLNQISYLTADDGFARDRELIAWFVQNARMLQRAGWQPVTHARVDHRDVACERYGRGDVVYYPIVNLGSATATCELRVDLAALQLSPADGEMSYFTEVAQGDPIHATVVEDTATIRLELEPNQARIIKLSRSW